MQYCRMTNRTDAASQYRSTAADIRAMAQQAATPELRKELLFLAGQFDLLADRANG